MCYARCALYRNKKRHTEIVSNPLWTHAGADKKKMLKGMQPLGLSKFTHHSAMCVCASLVETHPTTCCSLGLGEAGRGLPQGGRRLGEGWKKVGEGWHRVGEGWQRVGGGWERVGRGFGDSWERVREGWERVGRGTGEGWERVLGTVGRGLEGWGRLGGGLGEGSIRGVHAPSMIVKNSSGDPVSVLILLFTATHVCIKLLSVSTAASMCAESAITRVRLGGCFSGGRGRT